MKKIKTANILSSFKSRKFKYGGYATLMTAVVVALLFIVNLVVDLIPARWDLTRNKMYSLSEQTYDVLEKLEADVTIYTVAEGGTPSAAIEETLRRYKEGARTITIDNIDPIRDPLTAQKYTKDGESLSSGSLVVESGEKYRIISPYDMVNYTMNQYTGQYNPESLAIEQRVTSAILFVSGAEMPVAYVLDGHDEKALPYDIEKQMQLENYEVKSLNLVTGEGVPEDASLLIINSPRRDLSAEEEQYIRQYLENEGRAIFLMDLLLNDMPNFNTLFKSYGIALQDVIVVEGSANSYAYGNPLWVVPEFKDHDIVSPLVSRDLKIIVPGSQGIEALDVRKSTLKIEPLMVSSSASFGRAKDSASTNLEKEEEDLAGPFNLAVAVTDDVYDMVNNETKITKLVVFASSGFLETGIEGSTDLLLNSFNWLHEREEGITIRPKSLKITPLKINEMQYRIYGALTAFIIPLLILASGLVVWLRRRHL